MSNKIRAVYEALEMRKTKQALKLLVPLLEKKPDSAQLKILKALSLLRSGKAEEALKMGRDLKKHREVEGDETLLGNLAMFFREAGVMSEATELFVSAWERQPANENVARSVFAAYGRERSFLKQQQMAQKLFKQFGSDTYSLWAICATTLQVLDGAPPKLLVLAERQMAKRAEEGKVGNYEELQLYLEILTQQGKYKEAHEVVCGKLGDNYSSKIERMQAQASFLCKQERWAEAEAVYRELLSVDEGQIQGREEWSHVRGVLDCIMAAKGLPTPLNPPEGGAYEGLGKGLGEGEWAEIAKQGEELVRWLDEHQGSVETRTSPLLRLELYSRAACLRGEDAAGPNVAVAMDCVAAYFQRFGGKDVCAYDLVEYLRLLPRGAYPALLAKLRPLAADTEAARGDGADAGFEKAWLRYTCMQKLERLLGGYAGLPMDRTLAVVSELLSAFSACGRLLVRKEGYPADRTPSDDCCLVAARLLLDRFWEEGKEEYLLDAIVMAHHGLTVSPTNFQFKLLLISLYGLVGAYKPAHTVFTQLDVKHILWDTLTHLIQPASWQWAATGKIKFLCEQEMRLDRDNRKDTPDYTFLAFKNGTFSKVSELIRFESRLMNSLQLAASRADWASLSLLDHLDSLADAQAFLASMGGVAPHLVASDEQAALLRDNRDVSAEVTWDPLTGPSSADLEAAPAHLSALRAQVKLGAAGFVGDGYLCVLSWVACLHLARLSVGIREVVEGAGRDGGGLKGYAEAVVREEQCLKAVLDKFLGALSELWAVPQGGGGKGGAQLRGWQLRVGIEGMTALCVRALAWGPLCLSLWVQQVGGVQTSKSSPPALKEAVDVAKGAVRGLKASLSDFAAAALKVMKHAEGHHTAEYAKEHPEVLGVLEGAGEERGAVMKAVDESRIESIKAVKDMLNKRQEMLKAAK